MITGFELKTAHVDYFCGQEMEVSIGWERAVRQAYMPVNGGAATHGASDSSRVNLSQPHKVRILIFLDLLSLSLSLLLREFFLSSFINNEKKLNSHSFISHT